MLAAVLDPWSTAANKTHEMPVVTRCLWSTGDEPLLVMTSARKGTKPGEVLN